MTTRYRKVSEITADELLAALRQWAPDAAHPQFQVELFRRLGGDPDDHDYARLSFLTRELRQRGIAIGSSRVRGLWLEATPAPARAPASKCAFTLSGMHIPHPREAGLCKHCGARL